ncbi:peroxide stress protein YaaA [Leucobacter sp. cx-328]|uniref:YaaA family protein n=1 Tax=unclassified Leucobacter TaxID=2621730 RepID=UPI00165DA70D|nr:MULTISPECIES: peroxide stress protein YaaA [unclassified Leucobacter]MBC9943259.1 peroxide stress protein YaaA [Leucobacter sp. cx-328]
MRVLLPPSETKRLGGSGLSETLSFAEDLSAARAAVRSALIDLSGDEDAAIRVLKLGVKNRGEAALNLALSSGELLPAIERYTGVLYDALDVDSLAPGARTWVDAHVFVQSALFGLIAATDAVPSYRLSASTRLPALTKPLKRTWQDAHANIWDEAPYVLDLRAKDYAALAPLPVGVGDMVEVLSRAEDGTLRALNHFNKAGKGSLVRELAQSQVDVHSRGELLSWAAERGIELSEAEDDPKSSPLRLITNIGAPGVR